MAGWLASIVGVVVIGVVVNLLTQNRRLGNFIRSIYGFVVLLVIIAPLPNFFHTNWWSNFNTENLIDAQVVDNINQNSKQLQIKQILNTKGYENAIVTVFDGVVYVNLGVSVDENTLNELHKILGQEVVII